MASAFVIPFDAGVHSYIDHTNGKPRLASPHGWTAIKLLKQARRDKVFWKYRGHNHFVFFSITIFQMVGIGVKYFWMGICQSCTGVVIETSPTSTAISGRNNKYWYAAPYPSSYHWWEGIKVRIRRLFFLHAPEEVIIFPAPRSHALFLHCSPATDTACIGITLGGYPGISPAASSAGSIYRLRSHVEYE